MPRVRTLTALAVTLATIAATAAYASAGNENDATAVANARVSLSQAVQTAEQHVHGRASKAEYEHTREGWAYDVEVVNGQKVFDVKVDARDGSVLASTTDRTDHDDQGDETD
ncbi:PepSY domain-containing protein [Salinisphaera sp. SWV1]|uniref:PepSY domain-containing protein n=1 Tax=Salinisphaera sp. SWV1 TaxID=3454139 RepID=UPI003F83F290